MNWCTFYLNERVPPSFYERSKEIRRFAPLWVYQGDCKIILFKTREYPISLIPTILIDLYT